ncbi:serine hydrolase domain-containing protein [Amphibacillus jilinensis]|uniref:serine hydrolase domain-containing protein n=1 Tax=Amphibacillus jilinensis TaxID=1216008 RepID=UPI0003056089|nr:serine hydrolase domain-containing protein [Amphibacillus jilinensis]
MIEAVNQNFKELMRKKLSKKSGTQAVVGWFYEDLETVVSYGDFGLNSPEIVSFQIGSVTKLFTATLSSAFHYDGKMDLKGYVGEYLQLDAHSKIREMKVEDLLTHHAGLPSAPKALLGKYDKLNPYQHVNKERLMDYLNNYRKPVNSKSSFQYSNLGFSIIGQVLEEISGKTYGELVKDEICKPLGIKNLWITRPEEGTILAPGAMKRNRELDRWELNSIEAAGAIDANIKDMLKFAKGNLQGHPFYSRCEIGHKTNRTVSKHLDVGLGWMITRHEGIGELHSHNGSTGGFNSFLGIHPEDKFGVVVLTNCRLPLPSLIGLCNDHASAIGFEGLKYISKIHHNMH